MKSVLRTLSVLTLTWLTASPALALIEARLTYTGLASKPNMDELYDGSLELPNLAANIGMGADAMVFIPLTGFGFGMRYENMGLKGSEGNLSYESKATRTSLLVAYRLINTFLHLGPTFTYGLSHSGQIKFTDGSVSHDWKTDSASSYSVGLDVGVGLAAFVVGAEAGYQSMKWNKMKDQTGTSVREPNADLSGTYAKVYFGLGI